MTEVLSDLSPYLIPANVGKTADKATVLNGIPFGFDDGIPNWPAGIKPTILNSTVFGHPVLQCNIPKNDGSTKTRCEVWANTPSLATAPDVVLTHAWDGRQVIRRGDDVTIDFEVYTDLAGWGARDDYGQILLQLQGPRSGPTMWTAGPVEVQVRHGQWRIGGGEGVWEYQAVPFADRVCTHISLQLHVDGPGKGWYTAAIAGTKAPAAWITPRYPKLGTIYDDQQYLIPRPALYGGDIPDRRYVNFGSFKVVKI